MLQIKSMCAGALVLRHHQCVSTVFKKFSQAELARDAAEQIAVMKVYTAWCWRCLDLAEVLILCYVRDRVPGVLWRVACLWVRVERKNDFCRCCRRGSVEVARQGRLDMAGSAGVEALHVWIVVG